jgi:Transmembrane secretion effector
MLRTLRHREFRLLWTGQAISMVGDGVYFVALPWQVYEISNTPTALAVVGVAWTLPMVFALLGAGVASDRLDRRSVLIAGDVLRFVSLVGIAALSLADVIELWHLLALTAVYGLGEALFLPTFTALVPQVIPPSDLLQANALQSFVRPLGIRFIGPALGGVTIEALGVGAAFALDAGTFVVSMLALMLISSKPAATGTDRAPVLQDLAEGWRYVRAHAWLWVTLVSVGLSLLASFGPLEVLLPYVIKNDLELGADTFGFVLGAGGLGSIAAALVVGRKGMPRRAVTLMYVSWTVTSLLTAAFAIATNAGQMYLIAFIAFGSAAVGNIVWNTLVQIIVPTELLGRVASFDWFVSIGLIPVSFALTGPIAELVGVDATLIGAGVLGAISMIALFFAVPAVRDPERRALRLSTVLP